MNMDLDFWHLYQELPFQQRPHMSPQVSCPKVSRFSVTIFRTMNVLLRDSMSNWREKLAHSNLHNHCSLLLVISCNARPLTNLAIQTRDDQKWRSAYGTTRGMQKGFGMKLLYRLLVSTLPDRFLNVIGNEVSDDDGREPQWCFFGRLHF